MSENGKAPTSAAERMRRYRKRHRRGQRIVRLQIGPAEIEALVSRGFLGPGDREDPIAIEYGLSVLIEAGTALASEDFRFYDAIIGQQHQRLSEIQLYQNGGINNARASTGLSAP